MGLISVPPQTSVDNNGDAVSQGWATWFSSVFNLLTALSSSGTTAQRPTRYLFVSRTFFDTTLGKPLWYNGTLWVDATGAPA